MQTPNFQPSPPVHIENLAADTSSLSVDKERFECESQLFNAGLQDWSAHALSNEDRQTAVSRMSRCFNAAHSKPTSYDATCLSLVNLSLSSLPPEIGMLSAVQYFDISLNALSELPSELGNMRALKMLDVSYNKLKQLPCELFELTNLTALVLSNNHLNDLPENVERLKSLKLIDLDMNKLSALPRSLEKIPTLRSLSAFHNSIRELGFSVSALDPNCKVNLSHNLLSAESLTELKQCDEQRRHEHRRFNTIIV